MKDIRWNNIIAIVAVVAVAGILLGNKGFRTMVAEYVEIDRLKKEITALEKKNEKLKKEIVLVETDQSYIEDIARRELGVVGKDEVEYRFTK